MVLLPDQLPDHAIFIVLPEEDQTKYFMVSLILQNLYREILTVADENGGRLKNRVVFFADELGTSDTTTAASTAANPRR